MPVVSTQAKTTITCQATGYVQTALKFLRLVSVKTLNREQKLH